MNASALTKKYSLLTPEERFRLSVAAAARDDDEEQNRLARAGQRLVLSMSDIAPYAHAFHEVAMLTFVELLDAAGYYSDAFARADDARDWSDEEEWAEDDDIPADGDEAEEEADDEADTVGKGAGKQSRGDRFLDVALAAGFILRVSADGWKLFCEQMDIPPFVLWEALPGFDRLERALTACEKAAFTSDGFLRWMNRVRPADQPELTEMAFTAEKVAATTEEVFRQRVRWWKAE